MLIIYFRSITITLRNEIINYISTIALYFAYILKYCCASKASFFNSCQTHVSKVPDVSEKQPIMHLYLSQLCTHNSAGGASSAGRTHSEIFYYA